jgi:hypothetical protein
MAPVKDSAVIGQVDVIILKVILSPSQIEAERKTSIARTHIRRSLHQGRPSVRGYISWYVRLQSY